MQEPPLRQRRSRRGPGRATGRTGCLVRGRGGASTAWHVAARLIRRPRPGAVAPTVVEIRRQLELAMYGHVTVHDDPAASESSTRPLAPLPIASYRAPDHAILPSLQDAPALAPSTGPPSAAPAAQRPPAGTPGASPSAPPVRQPTPPSAAMAAAGDDVSPPLAPPPAPPMQDRTTGSSRSTGAHPALEIGAESAIADAACMRSAPSAAAPPATLVAVAATVPSASAEPQRAPMAHHPGTAQPGESRPFGQSATLAVGAGSCTTLASRGYRTLAQGPDPRLVLGPNTSLLSGSALAGGRSSR